MPRESSITHRLLHEPLVHFVVLASLLFLIDAAFSGARKETIVVDRQTIDYLMQQREDLELRKLGSDERQETISAFVEDEILYREAYRRGLDKGDSRMRRNLILKMRGLLVGDIEAPTEEELKAFFEDNRERFTTPATWSLEHVYFSDPRQVPPRLLGELRSGLDPDSVGESSLAMERTKNSSRSGYSSKWPMLTTTPRLPGLATKASFRSPGMPPSFRISLAA